MILGILIGLTIGTFFGIIVMILFRKEPEKIHFKTIVSITDKSKAKEVPKYLKAIKKIHVNEVLN